MSSKPTQKPVQEARGWYADSAPDAPHYPPLQATRRCRILVIGGGYTGLNAAIELARAGEDVLLLEAERIGWGASGRNGGHLCRGYNRDPQELIALMGETTARALWRISEEAIALVERRIREEEIICDLRWGYLTAAQTAREMRELTQSLKEREEMGDAGLALLDQSELADYCNSPVYIGGLFDSGSGALHPLKYCLGLAQAVVKSGAVLCEHSRVLRLVPKETGFLAETSQGQVQADHVILAGNAYLGGLSKPLARRLMPAYSHMLATAPLEPEHMQQILPRDIAVGEAAFILNYFRKTPDQRLIFGGLVDYAGEPNANGQRHLLRQLARVFPSCEGIGVTHHWGGKIGLSLNRLPDLGRMTPQLTYAQGFSGHGLALACMAGVILARDVLGRGEELDVFTRIPHHNFPGASLPGGNRLAQILLRMAMLWYRLRDKI